VRVRVLELGYCSLPEDYTPEYSPEAEVLKINFSAISTD